MADLKCRTCKHFEPSPIRRKGWCRNPLLYSPQQSHLVDRDDLDCGHRLGNYWEPAESPEEAEPQPAGAEEKPEAAPLRFMTTEPQPATAAAGMVAWASSSGSGGNPLSSSGGSSGGGRVPGSGSGSGGGGGVPPLSGRPGGPGRPGGGGQGPERSVSYQPEERYWTDYLRIAFPVLGLLLLLGLFWFWAMALIDDDDDNGSNTGGGNNPTATATTSTGEGNLTPAQPTVGGTPGDTEAGDPTPTEGERPPTRTPRTEESPTPEEDDDGGAVGQFAEGDLVVTTEADLNMRSDPSLDGEVITVLEEGTELTVTGDSVDADDIIWVPVEDADGNQGWVSQEFLESAESE
jgi:hypothetical protein